MAGRLVPHRVVSGTEAVQMICLSDSNDGVCFSLLQISSILSGSRNCLGSGTREWTFILRARHPILPNTNRPFWTMWRINTARNIVVCWSIIHTVYRATMVLPPQQVRDLGNHPSIHMICQVMMKNTEPHSMWRNNTRTSRSHSSFIDRHQALFEFTAWSAKGLRAN